MKKLIFIVLVFNSITTFANPWDKLINDLSTTHTLEDLIKSVPKFHSQFQGIPLLRKLDFGYVHVFWKFDYSNKHHAADFEVSLILKGDSIIFGQINRLTWKGEIEERNQFSINDESLNDYIIQHNSFYKSNYSKKEFFAFFTENTSFKVGCGEVGSDYSKQAKRMLKWIESKNSHKFSPWLKSPNFELQAYAIEGLLSIQKSGKSLPLETLKIIEHHIGRNSVINNCERCLYGLETPLVKLITEL